ncbi:MAG: hypothetical protein HOC74_19565 [Gemmatimonadetes bacterium]|nr:hypothetical protein [Gemmatimonadota bacterium]
MSRTLVFYLSIFCSALLLVEGCAPPRPQREAPPQRKTTPSPPPPMDCVGSFIEGNRYYDKGFDRTNPLDTRNFRMAARFYEGAISMCSGGEYEDDAIFSLAGCYFYLGEYLKTAQLYEQLASRFPGSDYNFNQYCALEGQFLRSCKDDSAIEYLRRGNLYEMAESWEQALQEYRLANDYARCDQLFERVDGRLREVSRLAGVQQVLPVSPGAIEDFHGNMPRAAASKPQAVAVVIGNRDYTHPDIPPVDFAVRDATAMSHYIIAGMGYSEENVIFERDADKSTFERIFGTGEDYQGLLFNWVKADVSDLFVYYSGHGAPHLSSNQGYLMPVNCDPNYVSLNGYSLNLLLENLSRIPARSITVVIEACFSGNTDGGSLLTDISPVAIRVENPLVIDPRAVVFTSTARGQVSTWFRKKRHSLFTYFFLKGLQGEADSDFNRKVTVAEIERYLAENVSPMARRLKGREQDPQVIGREKGRSLAEYPGH